MEDMVLCIFYVVRDCVRSHNCEFIWSILNAVQFNAKTNKNFKQKAPTYHHRFVSYFNFDSQFTIHNSHMYMTRIGTLFDYEILHFFFLLLLRNETQNGQYTCKSNSDYFMETIFKEK